MSDTQFKTIFKIKTDYNITEYEQAVIRGIQEKLYNYNVKAGWYDSPREVGTRLALIHSEISEALEGVRKDTMDDHLPNRKTVEVELADAVIRILDLAGSLGLDLAGALAEKHLYNQNRADHKKENRDDVNGKKF
jgi:NTP pyrophosphatase (non-canonical NTP hydrolase)